MGKFKFKLKEEQITFKPSEVDPALIQRIEKRYGPLDMENDFFSRNLDTYFKTKSINKETGSIDHQVIKLASFGDSHPTQDLFLEVKVKITQVLLLENLHMELILKLDLKK